MKIYSVRLILILILTSTFNIANGSKMFVRTFQIDSMLIKNLDKINQRLSDLEQLRSENTENIASQKDSIASQRKKLVSHKIQIDSIFISQESIKNNADSMLILLDRSIWNRMSNDQRILEIMSLVNSVSGSSVGNTLTFLGIIIALIAIVVTILGYLITFFFKHKIRDFVKEREIDINSIVNKKLQVSNLLTRANQLISTKQLNEAKIIFDEIIRLDPDESNAYAQLGYLFLGDVLDKPDLAINYLKKAILLTPNHLNAQFNLLVGQTHAHRPLEEIEITYKKIIEIASKQSASDILYGKVKLFFADQVREHDPIRDDSTMILYKQALGHFKISAEAGIYDADRWIKQAEDGIREIEKRRGDE